MSAKILIVEDESMLAMAHTRVLARAGYDVVTAADAVSAISVAVRERPDLVLLDLGLPAGSGVVVLERLRNIATTSFVSVVAITGGMPDFDREERLLALGCSTILIKPVPAADLLTAVARELSGVHDAVAADG